jgi:hypothetical protein
LEKVLAVIPLQVELTALGLPTLLNGIMDSLICS